MTTAVITHRSKTSGGKVPRLFPENLLLRLSTTSLKGSTPSSRMIFPGLGSSGTFTYNPENWRWNPWEWSRRDGDLKAVPSVNRLLTYSFTAKPEMDGGYGYALELRGHSFNRTIWLEGAARRSKSDQSEATFRHWFLCPECQNPDTHKDRPTEIYIQPVGSWIGCGSCLENYRGERRLIELYSFYLHAGPKPSGRPRKFAG